MSERQITAVVLLSRSTTLTSLDTAATTLAAQSRRPDRTVVMVSAGLPPEVQDAVRGFADQFATEAVHTLSDSVGRAGAVREVLEVLAGQDSTGESSRVPEPQDDAEQDGTGASKHAGKRARTIDMEALERSRTLEAEQLAQVPERLRGPRRRKGRRVGGSDSWLWFLTEQTAPGEDALAALETTIAESPTTAAVGPKRLRLAEQSDDADHRTADDADVLVDVGLTLTHSGRIITGVEPGEIDQGQSDWRQDVLAVGLPGMLVRERTLRDLGGLDADLPAPWAEIDLCHRIWRGGERVAVQSAARALAPIPDEPYLDRLEELRIGQVLLLLKHRPALLGLLTVILLPVTTLLRVMGAIAASQPRRIPVELRAAVKILRKAPRALSRGARERHRARVPGRRLAPLYLPRGEGIRQAIETVLTNLIADDDRTRRARLTSWGIAGTRHGIDDADYGRHIVWTVVVAVAAAALSMITLRGLFGRGELSGPALIPLPTSWGALREAAWASWIPGGLGQRGPADPLVRLLGHLPWSGALLVEVLVFAAVPVSALFAWWAAGAITRAVGGRLTITVTWALAPPLLAALAAGAWPLLLVHMLLPLFAVAIGRAIGLPHKEEWASVSAAAAAGLLLMVLSAVTPVLLLLAAVALALIAPAVPGRRLRLLWAVIPSIALHLPYLAVYIGNPHLLLSVGGVAPQSPSADLGDQLALWPTAPSVRGLLETALDPALAQVVLMLPVLPVMLTAVAAPFLAGHAGRAGRFALLMAAVALIAVLVQQRTPTAVVGGAIVPAAPHALFSVLLLALCVGGAAVFDALARREGMITRSRRLLTGGVAVLVAAACAASVIGWTIALPRVLDVERVQGGEVPAAAADQGRTDARARVLVLRPDEDGTISAEVVVQGEDSVIQHASIASLREVGRAQAGEPVDGDPGSEALRRAVTSILAPGDVAAEADHLALAYVYVPGSPEDSAGLVDVLDSSSAVEKVTQNAHGGMWRVIDATPRAWVEGSGGALMIPSRTVGAAGEIPASEDPRTVVLSERFDSQWRAQVDGTELEPVAVDDWAQGFVVPAGAEGNLVISRDQPWRPLWQALLLLAAGVSALISIPWRGRSRPGEEIHV